MPENQPLTHEETRDAVKEGIKEWMDEKYREVGKWAIMTIVISALGALMIFILTINGWVHK